MGYGYDIKNYYKVKKNGEYPAPCPADKFRMWPLYTDDILTKNPDGTFVKHTGLCIYGIVLKKNEVVKVKKTANLVVI